MSKKIKYWTLFARNLGEDTGFWRKMMVNNISSTSWHIADLME